MGCEYKAFILDIIIVNNKKFVIILLKKIQKILKSIAKHIQILYNSYIGVEVLKMSKTDNLTIRVEPELKKSVEAKLKDMGITMAQAITMYFKQIDMTDSIPFTIKRYEYSEKTLKAMENTKKRKNLTGPFKTTEDMKAYIEKESEMEDEE